MIMMGEFGSVSASFMVGQVSHLPRFLSDFDD
jgi:hypothetical protein